MLVVVKLSFMLWSGAESSVSSMRTRLRGPLRRERGESIPGPAATVQSSCRGGVPSAMPVGLLGLLLGSREGSGLKTSGEWGTGSPATERQVWPLH